MHEPILSYSPEFCALSDCCFNFWFKNLLNLSRTDFYLTLPKSTPTAKGPTIKPLPARSGEYYNYLWLRSQRNRNFLQRRAGLAFWSHIYNCFIVFLCIPRLICKIAYWPLQSFLHYVRALKTLKMHWKTCKTLPLNQLVNIFRFYSLSKQFRLYNLKKFPE